MFSNDFYDFQAQSKNLSYDDCPYTKVCRIMFERFDLQAVKFKISHDPYEPWSYVNVVKTKKISRSTGQPTTLPKIHWGENVVTSEKEEEITKR